MGIDDQHEVVINEDTQKMVSDENAAPDEGHYEKYTGNTGPTLEYWYHKAMIVIWPWEKWVSVACNGGMCGALDILETKAEEGDPQIITMLHEVLTYWEGNGGKVFNLFGDAKPEFHDSVEKDDSITARLLKICLKIGRLEDVVQVLKLLSQPFQHGDSRVRIVFTDQRVGIKDADTATAIASAVQRHGWINGGPLVMEMLITSIQVEVQGNYFIQLAFELHRLGCEDAGLVVAKRILEMADTACSSLHKLKNELVGNMGKLIFRFKGCMDESGLKFFEQMRKLKTFICSSLIVQIYAMFSEEIATQGDVRRLFKMTCKLITRKDFHQPSIFLCQVEDLLRTFLQLGIINFLIN